MANMSRRRRSSKKSKKKSVSRDGSSKSMTMSQYLENFKNKLKLNPKEFLELKNYIVNQNHADYTMLKKIMKQTQYTKKLKQILDNFFKTKTDLFISIMKTHKPEWVTAKTGDIDGLNFGQYVATDFALSQHLYEVDIAVEKGLPLNTIFAMNEATMIIKNLHAYYYKKLHQD